MGLFPSSNGDIYILAAIDYVSKWVEAQAFPASDAQNVVNFFKRLFTRFGILKALISDRGTHFCNYQMERAMKRFLQINKLDEMRLVAYESSISYKERTKRWHDKQIKTPTKYEKGDKVLIFNSRLRLFPGKLKSRWYGPVSVSRDMKNGAIELYDENGNKFIINKQRVKPYQKDVLDADKYDNITLEDEGEDITTIAAAEPQVHAATITAALFKDKGKGIMVEEPKPLKKKQQVEMDEELDYFKGMSYDDIRPIFKAKFNSNIEFLLKTKKKLEDEENTAIQSIKETLAQKVAKRKKLNEKVKDLKQHLEIVPDEDDDVYTEATALARKRQRTVHGQAKVKSWKLLESCGVHIITFTTTQLIVEKRYLLLRFTLDQMLNAVRLRVEEQSEISLELLRFTRQQHQEGQLE
uniref:Integrase catalytic domain-containing protein n=1 Tax=Tanacetum cinerariifolium TaxID=118510 RepID=A0A6L2NJ80_TANCI|nr:hypothetical protein [Tanacetum cinerariifolium]